MHMLKRLAIYSREMYPIVPRLLVAFLLVSSQLLGVLAFSPMDVRYRFAWADVGVWYTIFAFLFCLRIADEFKDYENDLVNYPKRPLPSGRVYQKDLLALAAVLLIGMLIVNVLLPHSLLPFAVMLFYGFLMTVWFFQREKIEPSLVWALVTHNPVQLLISLYIIHYAADRFDLPLWTWQNVCLAFAIYIPALLWEVSRKIKAPEDENQYVTYSQVWGFRGSLLAVASIALAGLSFMYLLVGVHRLSLLLFAAYFGLLWFLQGYERRPQGRDLKTAVPAYLFISLTIFLMLEWFIYRI